MNWLKNAWYVAGFKSELDGGAVVARRLLNTAVVMLRHSDGRVAALEDVCPHRLLPLSAGTRVGDELQCGYHGIRIAVDGACTLAPGQVHIPKQACVRKFALEERHGLLWIWLGDAPANSDLIPNIHWNESDDWACSRGYHHVDADFRLAVDNLMDLGHESWVHLRTIGQEDEEAIPSYPVKVTVHGDGAVRAHREMPNIDAPPFFAMVLDHQGRINRWQTAVSSSPSICMTDFGVYPVGTSADNAYRSHVLHMLTPETENTTHYFWSVARNRRLDDEALTESVRQAIVHTFDEDAVVLSLQQKQVQEYGGPVPRVALKVDEAPIRARRMLDALIKREEQEPGFIYQPALMIEDTTPELSM
ncbi:aromatic ring-hydroxylating dioxygenase subunit alpha [Comamonas fluminis]|uniref:aromatic ring-hydroxylating dioxygenase subunit alpha n=1 Tax=Comamonas fluminis TaxID=2796366 RepID=UPI001C496C3C|nr:aromatic ring-hydroxylating dioxygenase subunit alpha [Comamonas fluminis]